MAQTAAAYSEEPQRYTNEQIALTLAQKREEAQEQRKRLQDQKAVEKQREEDAKNAQKTIDDSLIKLDDKGNKLDSLYLGLAKTSADAVDDKVVDEILRQEAEKKAQQNNNRRWCLPL